DLELLGRSLALEVNQDPLDDLAGRQAPRRLEELGGDVGGDAPALADLDEDVARDLAGAEVAVQRIDKGVGLGVVAEEGLAGRRALFDVEARPRADERGELVTELVLDGAEAEAKDVLEILLEGETVPGNAVEAEFVLESPAHLLG